MKEVLRAEPVLYGMPNDTDFALCTLQSALFLIFIKKRVDGFNIFYWSF